MRDRIDLLQKFVSMAGDLKGLSEQMRDLGWDYLGEPLDISASAVESVLDKFLAGEIAAADVEYWADFLEGREDVEASEPVQDAIYRLANPELGYRLVPELVSELLHQLRGA